MNDELRNKMQRRIYDLEARCGALMNDADRRERAAMGRAEDCVEHGREIQYLRHLTSWCWHDGQDADEARRAIVGAIIQLERQLGGMTEPVPVDKLRTWVKKTLAAYDRKAKKPPSFPTLADCGRVGGCDHDDISPELKTELETSS